MAGKFLDSLGLAYLMSLLDKRYNGGSVSGGGVVDVSALPTILWGGSTLPTDSSTVVDYLYFNTELSVQEVVDILSSANLSMISTSFGDATRYVLTCPIWSTGTTDYDTSEHSYSIYYSAFYDVWVIANVLAISSAMTGTAIAGSKIIFASKQVPDFGIAFEGWNHDLTYPLAFGMPTFDISCAYNIPTQHNKLSTLVSTAAFTRIPFNENLIYRLEHKTFVGTETIYVGDIVPNSGTVDMIYFNTEMTVADVVFVLSKLSYTEPHFMVDGGTCYYIAVHTTSPWNNGGILHVLKEYNSDNYMIVYSYVNVSNNLEQIPLFSTKSGNLYITETATMESTFVGWNLEFSGSLDINASVESAGDGYTIGNYNYLISTLVATSTNFTDEVIHNDKYNYSYTYHTCKNGVWTQLSDTYNPQIFTEVDGLPVASWSGTTVPCDGVMDTESGEYTSGTVVENLYFNTEMSNEEVVERLKKLSYIDDTMYAFFANFLKDVISAQIINGYFVIFLQDINVGTSTYLFNNFPDESELGFVGWNPDVTFPINENGISVREESDILIGAQNDLISDLFSTTPFVKNEESLNSKTIYKLKEATKTHKEGTLLVSNPDTLVEKVIFNTDLSVEEVTKILSQLTYTTLQLAADISFDIYPLFSNPDSSKAITAFKVKDGYEINYITNIYTLTYTRIFLDYSSIGEVAGWHNTEFEINETGITEALGISIGTENNTLTQLVSMNDDFETIVDDFKYTYHAYNGQEYVRLDGTSDEDKTLSEIVITKEVESISDDITITPEEYNLMHDNTNVRFIVKQGNENGYAAMIFTKSATLDAVGYAQLIILVCTESFMANANSILFKADALTAKIEHWNYIENITSFMVTESVSGVGEKALQLNVKIGGAPHNWEIPCDDEPYSNSNALITSGGVYKALQDTLKKTDVKFGEQDAGFSIGEVEGSGDKNLFFDATNKKWRYCDTSYEDELTDDANEIATVGDITTTIGDINTILDKINGEEV